MLVLGLTLYTADTYQQLVSEDRRQSIQSLLKLKTSELTQALFTKQKDFASRILNEDPFLHALATRDIETIETRLKQVFSNSGNIHFKSILLRDPDANLITGVHEYDANPYNGCPVIIDQIAAGRSESRQVTKFTQCTQNNSLMSEVVVATGSPDPVAYIHLIAYLKNELTSIDDEIKLPTIIQDGQNLILYQSPNWQDAKQNNNFSKPVMHTLYGDDNVPGLFISAIYDQSQINQLLESGQINILIVAGGGTFIVLLLILLLLFYSFKPVALVRKSLGKVLNDRFVPINCENLPYEFQDFAVAYNKIIMVLEDASDKHSVAEKDLRSERDFISKTLDSISNSVLVIDSKLVIKLVNPAAEKLLGESEENLKGYSFAKIIIMYTNGSMSHIASLKQLLKKPQQLFKLFYQVNDEVKELEMMASPMVDLESEDVGHVLVFKDVTEDRLLRRKLDYESRHDKLTGLLNRIAFESKFDEMISEIYLSEHKHVFVYINLDNFRMINQSCSVEAGDLLLKQVTEILFRNVRKSDLLARLGGDEFGLFLAYAELENAANTVSDILADICKAGFNWDGVEYPITASAALISFSEIDDEFSEIFSSLTTACYLAKQKGGNQCYRVGDNDIKVQEQHSSLDWVARINKGFVDKRFKLYAQPIEPTGSNDGKQHYEILIRYLAEDDKIVLPVEFLGAAERFNLTEKIDRWVVSEVIHQMAVNPEFKNKIQFSINLSERSVSSSSFHRFLYQILQTDLVDTASFCFDITEAAIVKDVEKSIKFIRKIHALGAKFSLDDFGTGLSSLTHLQQFPVDYLKIDGVFINNILKDDYSSVFVRSITEVGHSLGIKVIAESVESKEMLQKLSEAKVDYLQGSAISKPFPIESI